MNIAALERMLATGIDTPLLRFGLGKAYLDAGEMGQAVQHLRACTGLDPEYSAAWKFLGKALVFQGDLNSARTAWESGIAAADRKGDRQARREMEVFLRRINKD